MIKHFYGPKKRRTFDMDADWLPQTNRQFVMNGSESQQDAPKQEPPKQEVKSEPRRKTTDAQGLKTAYNSDSGFYLDPDKTLHMAGTRGSFLGEDWLENYKVYGPIFIQHVGRLLWLT